MMNTVLEVRNVRHTASEHIVDMDVLFEEFAPEWLPYSAEQGNTSGNGDDLYTRAMAGEFGPIAPYVAPVVDATVPVVVTPRQAKLALLAAGLLDDVEAGIDAIADEMTRRIARIEWDSAHEVRRDWPLLVQIAGQIGITDEQLDELFVAAAAI